MHNSESQDCKTFYEYRHPVFMSKHWIMNSFEVTHNLHQKRPAPTLQLRSYGQWNTVHSQSRYNPAYICRSTPVSGSQVSTPHLPSCFTHLTATFVNYVCKVLLLQACAGPWGSEFSWLYIMQKVCTNTGCVVYHLLLLFHVRLGNHVWLFTMRRLYVLDLDN
jgi:hypothetical protein